MSISDAEGLDCLYANADGDGDNNIRDIIHKWNEAVKLQSTGHHSEALSLYEDMHEQSARVCYNIAICHIHLLDYPSAKKCLAKAVEKDERLAIAYYQKGLLNLKMKNYGDAIDDLESTRTLLRGNTFINYRPLGLFCRLHIFQILFNLALAYMHADDCEEAEILLNEAIHDADHAQRKHISNTLRLMKENRLDDIKMIPITIDKVFAPPKSITCNLESPASWKGSTVVYSSNSEDSFGSWDGMKTVERRQFTSSLKTPRKKPFRTIKSMNDIKVPMVNSDQYDGRLKRHSTGNAFTMETIRENKRKFESPSKLSRSFLRKRLCEQNVSLREDSIIEMTEPPEYEELMGDFSIQWTEVHDLSETPKIEPEQMKEHNASEIRHSSRVVTNSTGCDSVATILHNADVDNSKTDNVSKQSLFNRKSLSASYIDSTPKTKLKKEVKSTGDIGKRRLSVLPLEVKQTRREPKNLLTSCFGKRNQTKKDDVVAPYPTVLMSGCKAMAEMFSENFASVYNTIEPSTTDSPETASNEGCSNIYEENENSEDFMNIKINKPPANTLGSVFGDKSSVVKYALTVACDCLTSVATPIIDKDDLKYEAEKVRRRSNASQVKGVQRRPKSVKKRRAPSPPVNALAKSLAATTGMFAALANIKLENDFTVINAGKTEENDDNNNLIGFVDLHYENAEPKDEPKDDNEITASNTIGITSSDKIDNLLSEPDLYLPMDNFYCKLQSLSISDADLYDIRLDKRGKNKTTEKVAKCLSEVKGLVECRDDAICNSDTEDDHLMKPLSNMEDEIVKMDSINEISRKISRKSTNKSKSKKGSTRKRVSVRVTKGSCSTSCFRFKRAKTLPPAYPAPILTKRPSKKPSKRKKENTDVSSNVPSSITSGISVPVSIVGGRVHRGSLRPSLTSISESPLVKAPWRQYKRTNSSDSTDIYTDDSIHVFESLTSEPISSNNSNTSSAKSASVHGEKNYQYGSSKSRTRSAKSRTGSTKSCTGNGSTQSCGGSGNLIDSSILLNAFLKSSPIIQQAFDNFLKFSFNIDQITSSNERGTREHNHDLQ